MNILISAKQNKVGLAAARRVERKLSAFANVHFDLSTGIKLRRHGHAIKKFKGDLIITLGGDGTFLWTAHQTTLPILPIRIEGHGFLCTADLEDLFNNLAAIRSKKYKIIKRMRIKCTPLKGRTVKTKIRAMFGAGYPPAVNEVAFARKRPSKVLRTEFTIDGVSFDFAGDGLLFSTPAGSTAYNSSAGGPIMDQNLEAVSIVPLYPFHHPIKPIILPANKPIDVRVVAGECALVIDGHAGEYLKAGGSFRVERAEPVKVVHIKEPDFYSRYKSSFLAWKGRPE